jgi:hypothetical protein
MQVELLPNIHSPGLVRMPAWERIHSQIEKNPTASQSRYKLNRSHNSTRAKIVFADYHFHILNQVYVPKKTTHLPETSTWALAELNSIVMNLYSALDSLANEVNLSYSVGLDQRKVEVYHNIQEHFSHPNKNCLRCHLKTLDAQFSLFLDRELNQQWFIDFRETRRQLVHRDQPIYNFTVSIGDPDFPSETTVLLLPNEPCKENPQLNDYSKGLDFNTYCAECRLNIVPFIERTYTIMEKKMLSLI